MSLEPGIGVFEWVVIGLIALIVVGPKDLPLMFRKAGQFVGKLRGMAADFRSSFDEMARQSELDELRRELNALKAEAHAPLTPRLDVMEPLDSPEPWPAAAAPSTPTPEGLARPEPAPPAQSLAPPPAPPPTGRREDAA